ncbi:hypothetical protein ABTJ52_21455, partial [Acinetobacter baumannii]
VREEVAQGRLVRAEGPRAAPLSIEMEIRLYRARPGEHGNDRRGSQLRRKRELVDRIWASLSAGAAPIEGGAA